MSYIVPSVLVYQQLGNAGGVLNSTPDLDACIIGPAYNVLKYVSGDIPSLIKTAATSAATAVGTMAAASTTLTFTAASPFVVGDILFIPGATIGGTTLQAKVVTAGASSVVLDTAAGTAVTGVIVTKKGQIVSAGISNVFNIPNTKPGQVVETATLQTFVNNAVVQTLSTKFYAYSNSNVLTITPASGTATTTSASPTVTAVTNPTQYSVGDSVTITGAGAAGVDLVATILAIAGTTFTLSVSAGTAVTASPMVKNAIANISAATSTLLVEPGDTLSISYTDTGSVARTFTSPVVTVPNVTGNLSTLTVADVMPANMSVTTTLSALAVAAATSVTLTSATGFAVGDRIVIAGAGAGGTDLMTTIGSIASNVISGLSPGIVTGVSAGATVTRAPLVTVQTRKSFNNQLLPVTKPSGGTNYVVDPVAATVTINPGPQIVYGLVITADVHVSYRALRTDLSGSVLVIANPADLLGQLGAVSVDNPLALGVQLALANTVGQIKCIAVASNDLQGYLNALDLSQGSRVYAMTPLTQDPAILAAVASHVAQMSVPAMKSWRMALLNTAIPSTTPIGPFSASLVNANGGNNTIALSAGNYVLTASNATFISDGVTPGDVVTITASTGSPTAVGTHIVQQVISNQQIVIDSPGAATAVSYYVTRTLSKSQKAAAVAATSKVFGLNRVVHIQPDTVGVNVGGVLSYLPGYYLACALAGMVAGFPVQQGFTNISVAGISDLKYSNFYFTRAQINTMAEAGTFLFIQDTAGGVPYVRHELTTDVSVLQYREVQQVKNWDFLSYFYLDKLSSFIGKYNITSDTIQTIRQTIVAASELLKSQKLPRIGSPLTDYQIVSLTPDPNNLDNLICQVKVKLANPLNYISLYLII